MCSSIKIDRPNDLRQALSDRWSNLIERYLPIADTEEIWRFSRRLEDDDPFQGWKLHVSAHVLNACDILERCAHYLNLRSCLFKAISRLDLLAHLNTGLKYGFSQVGKCITVYPRDRAATLAIARDLHELTREFEAPAVPYDLPYSRGGCLYYRYGGFRSVLVEEKDGTRSNVIQDPTGKFIPDRREPGYAAPSWANDPFEVVEEPPDTNSPLATHVLVFDVLSQRGKGGVYRAVDLEQIPARYCILKEGRKNGEMGWTGEDGRKLLLQEEDNLRKMKDDALPVPDILSSFDLQGHHYLVLEYIEGTSLMAYCMNKRRKIPIPLVIHYGVQIAERLQHMHDAGWVWRDCKPLNMLRDPKGQLHFIDFEGAVRIDQPNHFPYGTAGYMSPEMKHSHLITTNQPEDLYALGATLYHLFTSQVPPAEHPFVPPGALRRGIPQPLRKLIMALLSVEPSKRPSAGHVATVFRKYSDSAIDVYSYNLHENGKFALKMQKLSRKEQVFGLPPGKTDLVYRIPT